MKAIGLAIAALCASVISMSAHAVNCTGLPEWSSTPAYGGGTKVQEAGKAYTAAWWSQGHSPAANSGQWQEWKLDGTCDNANHNPVAVIAITTFSNTGYHSLRADASGSSDVDGDTLTYSWTLNGQPYAGNVTSVDFSRTAAPCQSSPTVDVLTVAVSDGKGGSSSASETIYTRADFFPPSCYSSSSVITSSVRPSSSSVATTSASSSSVSNVNHPPVAAISVQSSNLPYGQPGTVVVSAAQSSDPDGDTLTYSWDGGAFSNAPTFTINTGVYFDNCQPIYRQVNLTVKDPSGATGATQKAVIVANPAPGNPMCQSSSSRPSSVATTSSSIISSSTPSSIGNGCTSPQFVVGTNYSAGQLVQNGGNEYVCNIAGWCSSTAAWAYAPGTGSYWDQAWSLVRSCGVTSSSIRSSSSSVSSIVESSRSSVSSTSTSSGNLPKHALVGYWHNFNNGSGLIRLADVDNTWDVIVIAFADDAGNGNVAFNLDSGLNKAQFIADVAAKRAAGKKVVLSFGGQNGTVTLNNATNTTNFVNSTAAIMNEYGFDGIDIDLESGANVSWGAPVITNLVTAIKSLKQSFPNLYLSMAPEHPYVQGGMIAASGIWGAYLPLIDGVRNELTILHVQLYNNGGLSTPYSPQPLAAGSVDFMVGSIKMLIEGFPVANGTTFQGLRPDQVAIGVPSGSRAASSGFVNVADLNKAVNCLATLVGCGSIKPNHAYPDFRGVMTWSINWDVADGRPFSIPVKNNLKGLDTPIQF